MLEFHQLQHKRIVMMSSAALVFGYFAIWHLFSTFFDKTTIFEWQYASKEAYLLICCIAMVCVVITIVIKSELDNRQITKTELYDQVTELPNGTYLNGLIKTVLRKSKPNSGIGLLIVGIEGLESINQTSGYSVGNQVIKSIAKRLEPKIGDRFYLARIAGDRFGLLFRNIKDSQPLNECAVRLLEIVKEPVFAGGAKSYVSFSIGAVFSDDKRTNVDVYIRQAELAFLHCKTHIDTNYAEFSEKLAESVKRLSSLETGLREALETGQIDLHYQPLISSDLESMIGVEALARWVHPKLGRIPPQEFVLIAEALGLTAKLGNVVLREACRSIKPIPELKLAVNISAQHFLNPNFIVDVDHILELTGFDPNRLEIEITENVLIGANDRANLVVKELQSRDITVALDDFGTGYTSIAYLNQFCVDRVKIDAEFIKKVGVCQSAQSTFSSIIELVDVHGFDVTVEGVETVEQIMFLKNFKNLCYQGFLFSKPLPYLDLIKLDCLGQRKNSTAQKSSADNEPEIAIVA